MKSEDEYNEVVELSEQKISIDKKESKEPNKELKEIQYRTQTNTLDLKYLEQEEINYLFDLFRKSCALFNRCLYIIRQRDYEIKKLTDEVKEQLKEELGRDIEHKELKEIIKRKREEGNFPNYIDEKELYNTVKKDENFICLPSVISNNVLKQAFSSYKSYIALLNKKLSGKYKEPVKLPYYKGQKEEEGKPRKGYNEICFRIGDPTNILKSVKEYKEGQIGRGKYYIKIPKRRGTNNYCKIPFPERLMKEGTVLKLIRIEPAYNGRVIKVHFVTAHEIEAKGLNENNALSIDLGVNNFVSAYAAFTDGQKDSSFIINGKCMKSTNHFYNKKMAAIQSQEDKKLNEELISKGMKTHNEDNTETKEFSNIKRRRRKFTDEQVNISYSRSCKLRDYMYKACLEVISYCIEKDIGTIIIGHNKKQKTNINLSKKNNQNFVMIPFNNFKSKLAYYCKRYGIKLILQEESYTSKSCFLNRDIPVYNPEDYEEDNSSDKQNKEKKSKVDFNPLGNRKYRGLYVTYINTSKEGKVYYDPNGTKLCINADINAAYCIGIKSKHIAFLEDHIPNLQALKTPKKINIFNKKGDK